MLAQVTASVLATAAVSTASLAIVRAPKGKGVFVRSVSHAGTPAGLAALCKSLGFSWAMLQIAWQKPGGAATLNDLDTLAAAVVELRKLGIASWAFAWPEPGRAAELAARYKALAKKAKLEGFVIDPEEPYYHKGMAPVASLDMSTLELLGVPIGVTTYGGGPPYHPGFPWGPWTRADFGIPQIYGDEYTQAHADDAVRAWREAGFKTIIPALGASDEHTADEIVQNYEAVRVGAGGTLRAVCWWDLYWLTKSSKRADAVRSIRMGGSSDGRVS